MLLLLLLSIKFPADSIPNTVISTCLFSIVLKTWAENFYFFFWQTRPLVSSHGLLFHSPFLDPLTYRYPQFSCPSKLGSPGAHAEKPSATWVPSTHWNTLSPLTDSIPSHKWRRGCFSIRLTRDLFSPADLITGRLAHNWRHSSWPRFHVKPFLM